MGNHMEMSCNWNVDSKCGIPVRTSPLALKGMGATPAPGYGLAPSVQGVPGCRPCSFMRRLGGVMDALLFVLGTGGALSGSRPFVLNVLNDSGDE